MSDVLNRIRRELQQRLESTRAAAQEHERVRAALEALEHAVKPLENVTRRAAGGASQRGRRVAARARPVSSPDGSATTGSGAAAAPATPPPRTGQRRAAGSRTPTATRRGRKTASASTAKAGDAAKAAAGARGSAKPVGARAPRGANREAVLAVVRERPGVTANELAAASGVTGGTLYALLRRLTEQGELAKRELPGGQTGYALATGDATVSGAESDADARARPADAEAAGDGQTTSPAASPQDAPAKPESSS
jgi:hypothetical protein